MSAPSAPQATPIERRTRQRDAIRHVLEHASGPLSPQQILAEAQVVTPYLGIATVYRAVKAMSEEHVLAGISLADGTIRYELVRAAHHHHFHCRCCNLVFDVPASCAGLDAEVPRGFKVEHHEVLMVGRCSSCGTADRQGAVR